MSLKKTFIFIFPLAFLLLITNTFAAEGESRIYLTVDDNQSAQEKTISAFIENAPLIYGADIRLTFDPAILEVVDADESQQGTQVTHGNFLDYSKGFVLRNQADNQSGVVDYVLALLNPAPPVEGNGLLTQVTFRAKGEGQTTVRIEKGQFGTQKGEVIDPTLRDDVTFEVAFDSATESFEVQVEAPEAETEAPEPEAEAESEAIVLPIVTEPEGFSTITLLLMGLVGGAVVVLGGQALLFGLRRRG